MRNLQIFDKLLMSEIAESLTTGPAIELAHYTPQSLSGGATMNGVHRMDQMIEFSSFNALSGIFISLAAILMIARNS